MPVTKIIRRRPQTVPSDLCSAFCSLYIAARGLSTTPAQHAAGSSNQGTPNPMHSAPPGTTKRSDVKAQTAANEGSKTANYKATAQHSLLDNRSGTRTPAHLKQSAEERAAQAQKQAQDAWTAQQQKLQKQPKMGNLASDSIFSDEETKAGIKAAGNDDSAVRDDRPLANRSPTNMAARLDPNPNASLRWARKMVIRNIRHRGRLTREMRIARTERSHTSKSRFFKTSVKKLSPLARQIAGKSIDEAILQMRFSAKKAAKEVHKHLIQARNEAVVAKGMGLPDPSTPKEEFVKTVYSTDMTIRELIDTAVAERNDALVNKKAGNNQTTSALDNSAYPYVTQEAVITDYTQTPAGADRATPLITDPSNTPALLTQRLTKALKKGVEASPTDIYVAQAWVNRGPYGQEAMPRARGRMDLLRLPHTGISVMLKEEKTKRRENMEKEIKAIRKRMNGKVWQGLPDRPIQRQSQYVLW